MPPPGLRLTVDELIQLANRRRFSEFLEDEWQLRIREGTWLALLMLDVARYAGEEFAAGRRRLA